MRKKQVEKLVLEAITKIMVKRTKVKGHEYVQYYVYIPRLLAADSAFPFKPNEKVIIRIDKDNQRLIIEKLPQHHNSINEI